MWQLLALHSCFNHSWIPATFSLVLFAHIEACQKTRSTWYENLSTTIKFSLILSPAARSPLYSHISSTIQGLSTIRSYKEEEKFYHKFHSYQDEHTKGWHTYIATNRWFGMRIDLISGTFLAFVVFSAIPLADSEYLQLSLATCLQKLTCIYFFIVTAHAKDVMKLVH